MLGFGGFVFGQYIRHGSCSTHGAYEQKLNAATTTNIRKQKTVIGHNSSSQRFESINFLQGLVINDWLFWIKHNFFRLSFIYLVSIIADKNVFNRFSMFCPSY